MLSTDILETYKSFLEELIQTDCTIKGENNSDKSPLSRKERLHDMLKTVRAMKDVDVGERTRAFVEFFESVVKHIDSDATDKSFWARFCEQLHKKPGRAHKIFFLNQPCESKDINIGDIASNQTAYNSQQIRNFVFILYCHVCKLVYADNFPPHVRTLYDGILESFANDDFVEETEGPDLSSLLEGLGGINGFMDSYKEMFDKVATMDGTQLAEMVFSQEHAVAAAMLKNFLGTSISMEGMRNELEKLSKEDVSNIVKELKSRVDTMDINGLLQTVQKMDPDELQAKVSQLLASVKE